MNESNQSIFQVSRHPNVNETIDNMNHSCIDYELHPTILYSIIMITERRSCIVRYVTEYGKENE